MKKKKVIDLKYNRESKILEYANTPIKKLEQILTTPVGVASDERISRQEKSGKNQLINKKFNHWKKILEVLIEPFNLLLLVIGLSELFIYLFYSHSETIDLVSALIIFFMIILAGSVDYIQDHRAYLANLELHHLVENNFPVYNGHISTLSSKEFLDLTNFRRKLVRIEQTQLTIGDLIYLEAGDVIPADVRIVYTKDLLINQSTLTGEGEAISKKITNTKKQMIDLENIAFAQTTILKGILIGVVINVGVQNYASAILKMAEEQNTSSDYEKGLVKITKILVVSILAMIPIILIATGLRTSDWIQALTFALSIAVSLTPEALPAIISSNLQVGSKKLAKEKVVIKNLAVVQNMGSVNILCTDKTGTLTNEEIILNKWLDQQQKQTDWLGSLLYLNAVNQQNISNQMDQGILKVLTNNILHEQKYQLISEEPFNHQTRHASVLVKLDQEYLQITKGSVEEMFQQIGFVKQGGTIIKITPKILEELKKTTNSFAGQGYRILVVASLTKTKTIQHQGLVYEGIALFEEGIKEGVQEAIKAINDYNIDLKILTGDSENVALNLAKNLKMKNVSSLTGEKINNLNSSKEICQLVKKTSVLAKLSPIDKATIIEHMKEQDNDVVAFLGDGVNDAVALKMADVGISVNNGTPLAKAAASVILLEKDLGALERSFVKGRQIFTNAIKYINITVAANFGLLFTLLISAIWFKFPAMSPIQLLMQNLIYDFANLIFVFDKVDDFSIKKPLKWNAKNIVSFALWNGLAATLISIINFLIIGYGFNLFSEINQGSELAIQKFQTMFFLESMITHMVLILVYRTEKISLIESLPSWQLVVGMIFFLGIALMLVYVPKISKTLVFAHPDHWWLLVMVGLVILGWFFGEIFKANYKKVFHHWF